MKKMENTTMVCINMLSALVSYPLFDQIYEMTGSLDSLGSLLKEIGFLISNDDFNEAFQRFRHLMKTAKMKIPCEIQALADSTSSQRQFVIEFYFDLEDYYTQELETA